jgi:hypothetical protein
MDEVSSHVRLDPAVTLTVRPTERLFRLVPESHDGRAPGADSEEKHEPVSDIETVVVDSLKALDPEWPIREADIGRLSPRCNPGDCRHSRNGTLWNIGSGLPRQSGLMLAARIT